MSVALGPAQQLWLMLLPECVATPTGLSGPALFLGLGLRWRKIDVFFVSKTLFIAKLLYYGFARQGVLATFPHGKLRVWWSEGPVAKASPAPGSLAEACGQAELC